MVATSSHLWQCVKDTSQMYCIDRWIYLNLSMFEHWLAKITIFDKTIFYLTSILHSFKKTQNILMNIIRVLQLFYNSIDVDLV